MNSAKIYLNNGETLVISTDSDIFGIRTSKNEAHYGSEKETKKQHFLFPQAANQSVLNLDSHHHAGMIPSLVELFTNYQYFQLEENGKTAYSCSAVTKIELL